MTNLEDPLHEYAGLSIFPATFPNLPPQLRSDDLLAKHNFLKSLPIKDQEKLLEQAKTMLSGGGVEVAAGDPADVPASQDGGEGKLVENRRGRRPGLGIERKRAPFTLLPEFSQSSINLEPTFDIEKYKDKDPRELFQAYERYENAKREVARLTGKVETSSYKLGDPLPPRPIRQGIPGRPRPKYKHLYPTMQENAEAELINPSPADSQLAVTDSNVTLKDGEQLDVPLEQNEPDDDSSDGRGLSAKGAVKEAEGRVDKILDELLSQDYEDLEGDKAISLLHEKLQIKPLNIEKLNLPEFEDVQPIDLASLRTRNSRKRRRASEIQNSLKEAKGRSFMKPKKAKTPDSSFNSVTLPKSPLASLARKSVSQSDPLVDPFPFPAGDIQSLPETSASLNEDVNKIDTAQELNSVMIDECEHTVGVVNSPVVADFTVPSDRSMEGDTTILNVDEEDDLDKLYAALVGKNNGGNDKEGNANSDQFDATKEMEGDTTILNVDEEDDLDRLYAALVGKNNGGNDKEGNENSDQCDATKEMEEMEPVHSAPPRVISAKNIATGHGNQTEIGENSSVLMDDNEMTGCPTSQSSALEEDLDDSYDKQNENNSHEPLAVIMTEPRKENTGKLKLRSNKYMAKKYMAKNKRHTVTKKSVVDDCLKAKHTNEESSKLTQETHEQETVQESLVVSANKQTKAATRQLKGRESRALSQRKSLAGAGSSYTTDGGLRRSTRIRSRPFEYWKGERFLFGRIHQSLPTVVGIKYQSTPGKEGKKPSVLKVKSYVSDEYQHLLDKAAKG